jgi:Holliday junction resolvase RusA-like endonuclease
MSDFKVIIQGVYFRGNKKVQRTFPDWNDFIKECRIPNRGAAISNATKKKYQKICADFIWEQLGSTKIEGPVLIQYDCYEIDSGRDIGNIGFVDKIFCDALCHDVRTMADDNPNNIKGFAVIHHVDAKNPRIEVTIRQMRERN